MPIAPATRRSVLERARGRCEYCAIDAWPLTVDHVVPLAAWARSQQEGTHLPRDADDLDNLAAACFPCNRAKSSATTGYDELTQAEQPLFNPRQHRWEEHFAWADDCREVVGCTPIGRATVARLRLNRPIYRRQRALLRAAMRAGSPPWP